MRITRIETIPIRTPEPPPGKEHRWFLATPFSPFDTAEEQRKSRRGGSADGIDNLLVIIETDEGQRGIGDVTVGIRAVKELVDHTFAPMLLGQSPFDVELLWERMYRSTINHGRKGAALEAISGLDIALWDIMGQALGQPVYNLLGGRTRDRLRCYISVLYATEDLDALAREADSYREQGFTAMKQRFGYGPADGPAGMRKNLELVKTVREIIGPDIALAADAYMGWDVNYAIRMIRMLENAGLDLAWVEEPVLPDDIEGYATIAAAVDTPISGGEHEFTRWGFRELINRRAVDIVQLDVNRCGGVTEARKIWAMAAGNGLNVYPHAGQSHNYHLIMAHMNSPLAEYFPRMDPQVGYTLFWDLFDGEPTPIDGYLDVPARPGFGLTLNEKNVDRWRADW